MPLVPKEIAKVQKVMAQAKNVENRVPNVDCEHFETPAAAFCARILLKNV